MQMKFVECTNPIFKPHEVKSKKEKEANTCIDPYPEVKIRMGRYPFLRDALRDCENCTGPVLVTDARDTYFQRDPFGDGAPEVHGLQMYAEHHSIDASHWFVARRVRMCKNGFQMNGPMICSGTTIADRESMLAFMEIMYQEMKLWQSVDQCFFKNHGGDQAIQNYLYYSGAFDHLQPQTFMPRNGIVNTVGRLGKVLLDVSYKRYKQFGTRGFDGADEKTWIGNHFDVTDGEGYFIDLDGGRSRVVHQFDRFGPSLSDWLKKGKVYDLE